MTTAPALRTHATYDEYLALERTEAQKHEYIDGAIHAMAGGTFAHGLIASNLIQLLGNALADRPCVVLNSDVRVRILATRTSTYPDVTVVCGGAEFAPDDRDAVTNPGLLVEVLSDATEAHDRGSKFAHYRKLASLREYVLVGQREARVEVFAREAHGRWSLAEYGPGERVVLASLGVELGVEGVYRGVEFVGEVGGGIAR